MNKRESKIYDIAKIISVILVVLAHSTRMYTDEGAFSVLNGSVFLKYLTEYIYKFHMPLFIMLSGGVFGICIENGKYKKVKAFLVNKTKRLLIPYLFFGFAYVAPVMCLLDLAKSSYLDYCYRGIILSLNSRHLWYLLALFLIFLIAIAARPLLSRSRTTRLVLLVISGILFCLSPYLPSEFQLSSTFKYQFYFFFGAVFHYNFQVFERLMNKVYYLFLALPAVLFGMFFFDPNRITSVIYVFVGIGAVLVISYCLDRWFAGLTDNKLYLLLKKDSFGIYIFHPMIIYASYYLLGQRDINPYLLCFGIAFVSLVVSIGLTRLFRLIKLGFFLGE